MNCFAMIAILLATPLVPAQTGALTCRVSLAELAVAAQAAEIAAEAADRSLAEVDGLAAKLESCRKERNGKSGCAKLAEQLKEAEADLDLVEEELSIALEQVDTAYDDFDIACSWEEGEANVLVRFPRARALRSPLRSSPSPEQPSGHSARSVSEGTRGSRVPTPACGRSHERTSTAALQSPGSAVRTCARMPT